MKTMMIIADGLADEPIPELDDQTTYEYARHDNLDRLASEGVSGYFNPCPCGHLPESMNCILNLLGVPGERFPGSRAVLELLAHGRELQAEEVVLRCNLVRVEDNKLVSFNGGSLNIREMQKASEQAGGFESAIDFIHLSGYRNLLVMDKRDFDCLDCRTYPPHEYLGHRIEELVGDICGSSQVLARFLEKEKSQLEWKAKDGQKVHYLFYPWGISTSHQLPLFKDLYGIDGAVVCGAEIVKGIGMALGLNVPEYEGFTSDTDTNLFLKAQIACSLLNEYDFVLVHINGLDEASHRYEVEGKTRFLEKIDAEFIHPLIESVEDTTNLFICADHATSPILGKHSAIDVPYIIRSPKIRDRGKVESMNPSDILGYLLKGI